MGTKGFSMAKQEIIKLIKKEGPMPTEEIKVKIENIPRLRNTRITSNRIGQHLRRMPFIVYGEQPNGTKIYAVIEE
tara:strand:- start:285 stop:512 length:228 start_codon:yes stop_codon:yes gene_type:complete